MPLLLKILLGFALSVATGHAAGFVEDFSSAPDARRWQTFGDASLFHWDSTHQNLEVTWDSSMPNSYFYRPLDTVLAKSDDFGFSFDLLLESIEAGANPAKPSTFEIAIGLINRTAASQPAFNRGTGRDSPHLVEFDYFPPADFIAATVSPTLVSSNSQFATSFTFPLELATNDWFHVELTYSASNQTLSTRMTRQGAPFGPVNDTHLGAGFSDFRVDAMAISSYNDQGDLFGSIRARGLVDNLAITEPPPPISDLAIRVANGGPQLELTARTNWNYVLERTLEFRTWTAVTPPQPGFLGRLVLQDTNAPAGRGFYRVRAERP